MMAGIMSVLLMLALTPFSLASFCNARHSIDSNSSAFILFEFWKISWLLSKMFLKNVYVFFYFVTSSQASRNLSCYLFWISYSQLAPERHPSCIDPSWPLENLNFEQSAGWGPKQLVRSVSPMALGFQRTFRQKNKFYHKKPIFVCISKKPNGITAEWCWWLRFHCISLKIDSYNAHCLLKIFSASIW